MIDRENKSREDALDSFNEERREPTNLISRESIVRRLSRGVEARARFVESHLSKHLAYQLRSLREREGWSQVRLARNAEMNQNAVSRLENPNYGKATLTTLRRIAKVFDVALIVRFVPFSQLADWVSGTPRLDLGLSPDSLRLPSFTQENGPSQLGRVEDESGEDESEDADPGRFQPCPAIGAGDALAARGQAG